ncbi:MAG: hypothetical protein CVU39_06400 [Chloroflexi bacterium HGW-Chloroflexi-10]|nr:MAG: hypothetical protein CVU39_06400 [Chloroflexi bacterium HGW-Chloroflexi-10]
MPGDYTISPARYEDHSTLADFLAFEYFVHRHLDWRTSLDWLGHQPFNVAKADGELVACYAAPPEPESVAWIRLFACAAMYSRQNLLKHFLELSLSEYKPGVEMIAALGLENWFSKNLIQLNFELYQQIIVLEWEDKAPLRTFPADSSFYLRLMDQKDLAEVAALDALCFPPLWQIPMAGMKHAFLASGHATVIELDQQIVGYQITTEALSSAHLARIAVHPNYRGINLGASLLHNLFRHYQKLGIHRITVNTQNDNLTSQSLYKKAGFVLIDESYPVFIQRLPG